MTGQVNYKHELVGCFGYPVVENPTGVMQEAAFNAAGLAWRYLLLEVQTHQLADAVRAARLFGFRGFNCTIPHKVEVLKYLDEVSPEATLMGAVNTVRREGERLIGENTDGKGFIRSLKEDAAVNPDGKRIVVLGAGGAARAITVELALCGAKEIILVNRSKERGEALVSLLKEKTPAKVDLVLWKSTYSLPAGIDILVNATSIGLYPNVHEKPDIDYGELAPCMIVCDVIPNPPRTPFLKEAETAGAHTLDGLGMLVYQGAIAFKMWTGQEASLSVMRNALAKAFGI